MCSLTHRQIATNTFLSLMKEKGFILVSNQSALQHENEFFLRSDLLVDCKKLHVRVLNPVLFKEKLLEYEILTMPEDKSLFIEVSIKQLYKLKEQWDAKKEQESIPIIPEHGVIKTLLEKNKIEWQRFEGEDSQWVINIFFKNQKNHEKASRLFSENLICYTPKKKSIIVLLVLPDFLREKTVFRNETAVEIKVRHRQEICRIFIFALEHVFKLIPLTPYGLTDLKNRQVYFSGMIEKGIRRLTFPSFSDKEKCADLFRNAGIPYRDSPVHDTRVLMVDIDEVDVNLLLKEISKRKLSFSISPYTQLLARSNYGKLMKLRYIDKVDAAC